LKSAGNFINDLLKHSTLLGENHISWQCRESSVKSYLSRSYFVGNSYTAKTQRIATVHVHRPPAVTLNETPEEFHISLDYAKRLKSNLLQEVCGHEHWKKYSYIRD
jgi:hypothetical protein